MRKLSSRSVVLLAAVAIVMVAACSGTSNKPSSVKPAGNAAPASNRAETNTASAPGVTATSVTVAFLASATGPNASSSAGSDAIKGAMARFALQNAEGGVNGRQIKMVVADDQSNPAQAPTAVQSALRVDHAFAIVADSGFTFIAARPLNQQGIPVVGTSVDGPEWCEQPYTNMFPILGDCDPHLPQYTTLAQFMKQQGATVVASFGYGSSPSSAAAARGFALAAKQVGLKVGYLNTSVPFNGVNVTSYALAMKQAGVNAMYGAMAVDTTLAILTAARQTGINLKVPVLPDGYGQALLGQPSAVQAAQGAYFSTGYQAPSEAHTPAVAAQKAAMQKYEGVTGVVGAGLTNGWLSADLFIKGLEQAGRQPTRQSYIAGLRKVTDYTAGGLLAPPASTFSLSRFGQAPSTSCLYLVQLEGGSYRPVPGTGAATCGTLIPNSDQVK